MALQKHKTIRQALEYVVANPAPSQTAPLDVEIWELIARNLFTHANSPNTNIVGSMARATKAQRIIMNRMTGTRRAGTHPAQKNVQTLGFKDLTKGALGDGAS